MEASGVIVQKPAMGSLLQGVVFCVAIGCAAIMVVHLTVPLKIDGEGWLTKFKLTCAAVSMLVAAPVWFIVMRGGVTRVRGAVAGALTGLLAVLASGPALAIVATLTYSDKLGPLTKSFGQHVGAALLLSMFALAFSGLLGTAVSALIGFLVAACRMSRNAGAQR